MSDETPMTESERFAQYPEVHDAVIQPDRTRYFIAAVKARKGRPARIGGWAV